MWGDAHVRTKGWKQGLPLGPNSTSTIWSEGLDPCQLLATLHAQGRQCPRSKQPQLPTRLKPCLSWKDLNLNSRGMGMEKIIKHSGSTHFPKKQSCKTSAEEGTELLHCSLLPSFKARLASVRRLAVGITSWIKCWRTAEWVWLVKSSALAFRAVLRGPGTGTVRLAGCQILNGSLRERKKIKP